MKETILAVDDEQANLRMIERLFHKEYRVLTANGGEEALRILEQETVALIITDQRMPGMTGTELLCESLHTQPDAAKIIITGYSDVEALIEAINTARVYKYVSKPWDPIELKQIVQDALREHQRRVEQNHLIDYLISLVRSYPDLFTLGTDQCVNSVEACHNDKNQLINQLIKLVQSQPGFFTLNEGT